jgi:hypothetical protein
MAGRHDLGAEEPCTESNGSSARLSAKSLIGILTAGSFVALAPAIYYTILFRDALDIPIHDDYHTPLSFLNQIVMLHGVLAKALFFLSFQHNEYKLFFFQGMAWLQLSVFGHFSFRVLDLVGDAFVLVLGIVLWTMFLPNEKNLAVRLALFIPVSWLLFQLQYWEDLNWAGASLEHLAVLPFTFVAIRLLLRGERWAFSLAIACLMFAVACDGNGFILIPIGVLILGLARRFAAIGIWLVASAGCIAAYAYQYNVMSSQVDAHRSVFSTFNPLSPAYVVAFIGSAASVPFEAASFVLGGLLCLFFAYLAYRRYFRKNPLVSSCVLFLLLTAIGVAGIRSGFGITQSLASRYTIYSALLLIFAWYAIVEEFLQDRRGSLLDNGVFLGVATVVLLFSLSMDWIGSIMLDRRNRSLVEAMRAYEHPTSPDSMEGPAAPFPFPARYPALDELNKDARVILAQSTRLGIYRPPSL